MNVHFNWLPFLAANIWAASLPVPQYARIGFLVVYLVLAVVVSG